jgi:hypothetical protein
MLRVPFADARAATVEGYRWTTSALPHHHGCSSFRSELNWKRQLNKLIAGNRSAIDKTLLDFGVPLLDENDRPITGDDAAHKP